MIFTKSAFSIKIQKTMKFHSIFGSQNEKNSNKNRFKKALFLSIAFSAFGLRFWNPKIIEKSQFFEKIEVRRPSPEQYRFEAAF